MTEHDTSSQQSASGTPDVESGALPDGGGISDGAKGLPPFLSWLPKTFTWVLVLLSISALIIDLRDNGVDVIAPIRGAITWLTTR